MSSVYHYITYSHGGELPGSGGAIFVLFSLDSVSYYMLAHRIYIFAENFQHKFYAPLTIMYHSPLPDLCLLLHAHTGHPFGENLHRQVSTIFMLFSLSCVYYYMLTRGRHPFGKNFHRQVAQYSCSSHLLLSTTNAHKGEASLLEELP
jgi:hypothetical protein